MRDDATERALKLAGRDRLAVLERDYDTLERALELAQARNLAPRTGEWGGLAGEHWSCLSVPATGRTPPSRDAPLRRLPFSSKVGRYEDHQPLPTAGADRPRRVLRCARPAPRRHHRHRAGQAAADAPARADARSR